MQPRFFLLIAAGSLFVGVASVSPLDLLQDNSQAWSIFWVSRLPRLLAIIFAGAGLSIAGLLMQQIVQNRFAAPSTTGTIDCAMLGYILSLAFFSHWGRWSQMLLIFACAMGGTLLFVRFIARLPLKNTVMIPLIGIMYGNVVGALTTFFAYEYDLMQTLAAWKVANFASVLQGNYELLFIALPVAVVAYLFAFQLNAASMGESFAKNIGLHYSQILLIGVTLVAILSASVVMIVGVIPFLGLIVPNLVSLLSGDNLRKNLPWTAYWGALLVLMCDLLGRILIFPYEVPIAMVMSVFGGAIFISLILKERRHG
ncbi:Petrobactin import system permease protein YclN [Vibrio stylophorae]|uniref:Petrobactin import system permease protein YclN n=1 Tax=Vibrio stylophorae TaxID=659351 RepID=A0ABN8DQ07_9VIBR|nr:iron chelate uptake ABC transporter family permease subunit [Vibrio stylophorae]CAH0533266.1 Petrobactin import system permease protein YclN [Vibrio stylophorae]